jgi:hypothetical protein
MQWALVVTLVAVGVTAAQPKENVVPRGATVRLLLLRQKSVQEELKLSADVVKKIAEFTDKQHAALMKALKGDKAELKKKLTKMGKENQQFLADTLTAEQNKRLIQITLQVTGLHQLNRPEVADALKLTKAQRVKLRALRTVTRGKLAKVLATESPDTRNAEFAKLRKETRTKTRALLTKAQKAKLKEVVGAPFKGEIVIEGREKVPEDK